MEKESTSTQRQISLCLLFVLLLTLRPMALAALSLSRDDALRIGKKIWQNECNGTVAGLTSWNAGEDFASLGIGHFIWYPEQKRGPFEESFPKLVAFFQIRGVAMSDWLRGSCPWSSRTEFERAQNSAQMKELRQLLADTADVQADFLLRRLELALPSMLDETAAANRGSVKRQFERVASSTQGCYALIDYVNFKGEGVLHTERYRGQGWGLLQVLEQMHGTRSGNTAGTEFSRAAAAVLTRRVNNSPPERHESRWLPGWLKRVRSYAATE
jgi:hypothetical protein